MIRLFCLLFFFCFAMHASAQLVLKSHIKIPELPAFRPLPQPDAGFSKQIEAIVKEIGLDIRTPAEKNPDGHEEWASVCVVDISDINHPRVGAWEERNFVYPASAYKLYVLGEAIRQVTENKLRLDDVITVKEHNVRSGSRLKASAQTTFSEVLRLMMMYSDNTAANEAIDAVDRDCASALLRAMGLEGSDITRKFLPRTREDDGYTTVPGTSSCALHFATFLWAVETGAIGAGRGRGLIKGYMSTVATASQRFRKGLPPSATLYSKSGTWNTFSSEVSIVEEGSMHYIICVLTALPAKQADPIMSEFISRVHSLVKSQHTSH